MRHVREDYSAGSRPMAGYSQRDDGGVVPLHRKGTHSESFVAAVDTISLEGHCTLAERSDRGGRFLTGSIRTVTRNTPDR